MTPLPDRDALLEALLPHVPFDGWGKAALRHAAQDLALDPLLAADLLPDAPLAQVLAFSDWADRRMLAALAAEEPPPRLRARIHQAARLRFQALEPHREAVRRGLATLALPHHALAGLQALHRTSDAIWTAAGESSTDYNWYSKRLLLAGVLSATTLYWLEDRSEDSARTWDFLARKLDQAVSLGGRAGQGLQRLLNAPDRLLQRLAGGTKRRYGMIR